MDISLKDGRLCIINSDGTLFGSAVTAFIDYCGRNGSTRQYSEGEWILRTDADKSVAECGNTAIYSGKYKGGLLIRTEFTNTGGDIQQVENFCPLYFENGAQIKKLLGSTIWTANGNRTNEMQSWMMTRSPVYGEKLNCSDFIAIEEDNGRKYILGFVSAVNYYGNIETVNGSYTALNQFTEFHPLLNGETLKSDLIYIKPVNDIVRELPEFIQTVAGKQTSLTGLTLPENFRVPAGYCTWYYHYSNITGAAVLEALDQIKLNCDLIPLEYYQIDAGWQDTWGDWNENGKFPGGMKYYAGKIKEAGLIPGIWIAPFGASEESEIYKTHPEYFIRDWNTDEIYCGEFGNYDFDFSNPDACEYIAGIIKRLTYEWGFSYLKIDFLTSTVGPYRHSDISYNACRNLRKGLEIIRNSVPEGTFILGCTSPFIPAVGYVDGMRTSGDTGGSWEDLKDVFNHALKRYYYHNILFSTDADCLIIRKRENEDDECRLHCTRNDKEIKSYISAMAATGGALMLSDKLNLLTCGQKRMISFLFPLNTTAALPLDLMEAEIPGVLDLGTRGKIRTVIFINWYENSREFSFNAGRKHAFEFWSQKYEGITDGTFTAAVEPHACRVMFFTDCDAPAVIGTDSVLVPDIKQNYDGVNLKFEFIKKGESFTVAAEKLSGENCVIEKTGEKLYKVTQKGTNLSLSLNT